VPTWFDTLGRSAGGVKGRTGAYRGRSGHGRDDGRRQPADFALRRQAGRRAQAIVNMGGAGGNEGNGSLQALIGMLLSEEGVSMLGSPVAANDTPPEPPAKEPVAAE